MNNNDKEELEDLIQNTITLYEKTILPTFPSLRLLK